MTEVVAKCDVGLDLHTGIRDGSLRHAAREQGAKVLLYEAGESLRFDAYAIDAGVIGVRRVLAALEMTEPVTEGDRLGALHDSFGKTLRLVHANRTGIVIGRTEQPLVNSGDALVHIAGVFEGEA